MNAKTASQEAPMHGPGPQTQNGPRIPLPWTGLFAISGAGVETVLCVTKRSKSQPFRCNAWGKPLCSHRPPAGELFGSAAMVCVDIVRLALQTRSVTISPSSRLVNITAPTDLHRPSDPQVSTERPSSFSFACKAVGPCTGMSADLQTRDGVHTRRPTPWH